MPDPGTTNYLDDSLPWRLGGQKRKQNPENARPRTDFVCVGSPQVVSGDDW